MCGQIKLAIVAKKNIGMHALYQFLNAKRRESEGHDNGYTGKAILTLREIYSAGLACRHIRSITPFLQN